MDEGKEIINSYAMFTAPRSLQVYNFCCPTTLSYIYMCVRCAPILTYQNRVLCILLLLLLLSIFFIYFMNCFPFSECRRRVCIVLLCYKVGLCFYIPYASNELMQQLKYGQWSYEKKNSSFCVFFFLSLF